MNNQILTYGIHSNALYTAKNITKTQEGYPIFDCYYQDKYLETFSLQVFGTHNISNALATIATCHYYHLNLSDIQKGLQTFTGANRRMQKIGTYHQIPIYDDYAHHPTEIKTTLESSKEIPHHKTWAIFEPHTFSRTKAHLEEFANILSEFDHLILTEIYAARETDNLNISSKDLFKKIHEKNSNCIYLKTYSEIIEYLKTHVEPQDIIITIGAGTINQIGYNLIKSEENQKS